MLLLVSGSGNTATLVNFAMKANEVGANLALVTTNPISKIGELADCIVNIPAATKKRSPEEPKTIQPLGSQFDQSAHLLLDALIVYNMKINKDKDNNQLKSRHANLEQRKGRVAMNTLDRLKKNPIVAVIRKADEKNIIPIIRALSLGGVKSVEITAETRE